ncbi:sodium:solute symporter family transporter [Leptospira haakeii]|uniref:Sodium:solute symporter n=1 Tax=Leptospira haakeii TaxID=2023198 RepID=A0ABX4PHF9_9LEPT|nr:sodium:solute symporter [Leptospira haakeii]PKA15212.1 sodium:solute symporter [Leptospira haakeii]PKA20361.1 sodium:solute symporter [Leptospira haakeii]
MHFAWSDALVLFFYFGIVLYSGYKSGRNSSESKEFFLANRSLSWVPLSLSIVATETSALTFLSVPGIAYSGNFTFLQVVFGYILGRTVVALVLIPLTYHHNFLSVYEWVGTRFGRKSQKTMSGLFSVTRVLGDGVRLYASTLPVAMLLELGLPKILPYSFSQYSIGVWTLAIVTLITVLYTMQGGFRSVVWVDTLQYFVYVFGGVFALVLLYQSNPEPLTVISSAWQGNKLKFLEWENTSATYFMPWAVLGGALLSLGTHGADQMFIQRSLAARNVKDAQKAMIGSGIAVFFQMILFLGIGTFLFYKFNGQTIAQDKVFSKFLIEEVPAPFLGLLLSGILASTMSTLSSSINSLSLTAKADFGWNLGGQKLSSVFFGILLFFSSFFFFSLPETYTKGLLELGLKISSFTVGSMVAVFLTEVIPFLRKRIIVSDLGLALALAGSILVTGISGTVKNYNFTVLVPLGMILFWTFAFLSGFIFLNSKRQNP